MSFGVLTEFLLLWCTLHNQKIERAIEYLDSGEFIEATPKSLRLRKRILDATARKRMSANIILNAARGAVSVPN
jgi:predicted membrane GTPase involved in stress response